MEYIHRMSGARGDDAKKLLQDWIVNVMSKSWEYVVSGEVASKVTPKDDPPIIPRERARKRDLSPFDPNDEPDVSIEYPGVTFEPPTKLMKGDLEYLSDISMEISSDSDSSPERNFYRSPQKVSHRAINNYKINKKPIILKNGKANEKIGKVNTGAIKKDGLIETLDKSQKNDDCVNKGNEKIGKVNTCAIKKDGLIETLDKSQKNDDCVNKRNEKIGKVNTGAIKKDGLIETLDKSQKNDDCVNKGNEKIGKVNTAAIKKDGLIETLDKSRKNDDNVIKDSNIERKSITIEEYKQRVKTMDSLHKDFNNFNSSNVISDIISNMNLSYPFNAQESTYDINYNNTYPIQTQANSNQFNLDAELQRAVKSIQPPEYEAYVVNMEVDSESKPFVETNESPLVEPVSSAIKTSFGSPAASYPILTSVDKNLQEDERIRSDLKQINKERVTLNIGGRNFETSYPILLRDEQSIFNVLFHEERPTTFFFDRDSSHFRYILNYLREDRKMDQIVLPKERRYLLEMLQEASFYRLEGLQQIIRKRLQQFSDLGLEF